MADDILDLTHVTYRDHKPLLVRVLILWDQVEMLEAVDESDKGQERLYVHLRDGKIVGVAEDMEVVVASLGVLSRTGRMGFGKGDKE